jgi:hypothetical protein
MGYLAVSSRFCCALIDVNMKGFLIGLRGYLNRLFAPIEGHLKAASLVRPKGADISRTVKESLAASSGELMTIS